MVLKNWTNLFSNRILWKKPYGFSLGCMELEEGHHLSRNFALRNKFWPQQQIHNPNQQCYYFILVIPSYLNKLTSFTCQYDE